MIRSDSPLPVRSATATSYAPAVGSSTRSPVKPPGAAPVDVGVQLRGDAVLGVDDHQVQVAVAVEIDRSAHPAAVVGELLPVPLPRREPLAGRRSRSVPARRSRASWETPGRRGRRHSCRCDGSTRPRRRRSRTDYRRRCRTRPGGERRIPGEPSGRVCHPCPLRIGPVPRDVNRGCRSRLSKAGQRSRRAASRAPMVARMTPATASPPTRSPRITTPSTSATTGIR